MAQHFTVNNLGSVGYIGKQDKKPFELPPEAWDRVINARCHNGAATALGVANCVSKIPVTGSGDANDFITELTYHVSSQLWWITFGSEVVLALQPSGSSCGSPTSHTLHTESVPYTGTDPKVWVIDKLFGNIIATNQQTTPLYLAWDAIIGTDSLQKLPGWEAEFGENASCEAIASAKGFILAGNISTTGSGRVNVSEHFATRIAWSDQILDTFEYGGRIPDSWDASDPTKQTGAFDLPSDTGQVIAMKRLRDDVIVYTERSMYRVFYVGGAKIWDYREIFSNQGIYGPKCVEEFEGKHFIVGTDDILLYDGQQVTTLADGRVRRDVYDYLTHDMRKRINIGTDFKRSEIHLLFPSKKSIDGVDSDLVWSWEDNVWTPRELETVATRGEGCYTTIIRENLTLDGGVADPDTSSKAWDDFDPGVTWDSIPAGVTWGSTISSLGDTDMYLVGGVPGSIAISHEELVAQLGADHYYHCNDDPITYADAFVDSVTNLTENRLVMGIDRESYFNANQAALYPNLINNCAGAPQTSGAFAGSLTGPFDFSGEATFHFCFRNLQDPSETDDGGMLAFRYQGSGPNLAHLGLIREGTNGNVDLYWADFTNSQYHRVTLATGALANIGDTVTVDFVCKGTIFDVFIDGVIAAQNQPVDYFGNFPGSEIFSLQEILGGYFSSSSISRFDADFGNISVYFKKLSTPDIANLYSTQNADLTRDSIENRIYRVANSYKRVDRETAIEIGPSVSILERQQIDLTGEPNSSVLLHVYPRCDGDYPFNIYVGAHDNTEQEAVWEGPFEFDPKVDHKIDCRVRGRRHALRFEAIGVPMRLFGYDIEHEPSGER